MRLSSIFSSDTLLERPRITRAGALALGLCLMVRILVAFNKDRLATLPADTAHYLYMGNEARYRVAEQRSPKILVLGTSRLAALNAGAFAGMLGWEPGEVGNYSMIGNTFWRSRLFLRRNPEAWSEARVVWLDLVPYQLYVCPTFTEADDVFLAMSTWRERGSVRDPGKRWLALADGFYPAWSGRHTVDAWSVGVQQLFLSEPERYHSFHEAVQDRHLRFRGLGPPLRPVAGWESVRGYVPDPVMSRVEANALAELISGLPANCTLLLTWLPVRSDFAEMLDKDPRARDGYRHFKENILRMARPRALVVWFEDQASLGFADEDFTDPVHFTETGMAKLCQSLAPLIAGVCEEPAPLLSRVK
ncbi:MAG: hypothetical protein HY706_06560 [Candidatus Hydrogenedentes bacterium]|nr:hypothetical protein [Candidatus Hydrogenedentota bacterium]